MKIILLFISICFFGLAAGTVPAHSATAKQNVIIGQFERIHCAQDGCVVEFKTQVGEEKQFSIDNESLITKFNDDKYAGKNVEIKYIVKKRSPAATIKEEFVTSIKLLK